jgi:hypothetical protein
MALAAARRAYSATSPIASALAERVSSGSARSTITDTGARGATNGRGVTRWSARSRDTGGTAGAAGTDGAGAG